MQLLPATQSNTNDTKHFLEKFAHSTHYFVHPSASPPAAYVLKCARAISATEKLRSAMEKEEASFLMTRKREW